MNRALVFLLLVCVIGEAYGHAVLAKPNPWWWAPSRTRPCGGANYTQTVDAIFPAGSNQSVLWWVVAGDGMGEVHARIDQYGHTDNFSNGYPIGFKQPVFTELGQFWISFIVPNITCHGPNNTCVMQFWTDSGGGWYSCATIQIACTSCTGGLSNTTENCVKASNLAFCPSKDGSQVLVPSGQTLSQIDGLTQNTFNLNRPNPAVFYNGNSTECQTLYHQFLCELYFTPCNTSTSNYTMQECQLTMRTCNLTQAHAFLYNCSMFPVGSAGGTTGQSSESTPLYVAWLCVLIFVIVSVLF